MSSKKKRAQMPEHVLKWAIKHGFEKPERIPSPYMSARQLADTMGMDCKTMSLACEACRIPRTGGHKNSPFRKMNKKEVEKVIAYIAVMRGERQLKLQKRRLQRARNRGEPDPV